jgi:hypothetical protein
LGNDEMNFTTYFKRILDFQEKFQTSRSMTEIFKLFPFSFRRDSNKRPKKQNPERSKSRTVKIPNTQNPERLKIPNAQNPEYSKSRILKIPNTQNPEYSKSRMNLFERNKFPFYKELKKPPFL